MGLAQDTDENLMLRFGRGEAAAFELLYRRHESRVFRCAALQIISRAQNSRLGCSPLRTIARWT
jgi:hypothetical protein